MNWRAWDQWFSARSPAKDADGSTPPSARAWWLVATGLLLFGTVHFLLVLISLVPLRPLPTIQRVAHTYVTPLFTQHWWLFAPNPPMVHRLVEARGIYRTGEGDAATSWVGITEPLIRAVASNRLSRHNAAWIAVLNASFSLTNNTALVALRGRARDLVLRQWSVPARQPSALIVLGRAGSAALTAAYPDRAFREVQLRLLVARVPPLRATTGVTAEMFDELIFPPVPFIEEIGAWTVPQ